MPDSLHWSTLIDACQMPDVGLPLLSFSTAGLRIRPDGMTNDTRTSVTPLPVSDVPTADTDADRSRRARRR